MVHRSVQGCGSTRQRGIQCTLHTSTHTNESFRARLALKNSVHCEEQHNGGHQTPRTRELRFLVGSLHFGTFKRETKEKKERPQRDRKERPILLVIYSTWITHRSIVERIITQIRHMWGRVCKTQQSKDLYSTCRCFEKMHWVRGAVYIGRWVCAMGVRGCIVARGLKFGGLYTGRWGRQVLHAGVVP